MNLFLGIELCVIFALLIAVAPGLIGAYGWGIGCSVTALGIGVVVLFSLVRMSFFHQLRILSRDAKPVSETEREQESKEEREQDPKEEREQESKE